MRLFRGTLSAGSLRFRIILTLVGLTMALGVVALVYSTIDLTNILEERLEKRGTAIARDLAAESAILSPINDVFGLFELVNDDLANNEDVLYIFLVEPSGDIRVHTFESGVARELVEANGPGPGRAESILRLNTSKGPVIDIAVPGSGWQGSEVRVGMTLANIRRQVLIHIRDLSLLVVAATLASFGASLFLSSLLTRPLVRLAEGAKAVGRGDLSQKVPVEAADELGDLANSFNTMTDDLVRSRDDLMRRNTELRNLNSMADHLSQHLAPEEIPESSLEKLLQMTGLRAGWICIMGDNGRLRPAGGNGGPPKAPPKAPPKGSGAGGCLCYQALQGSQGVLTPGVPECPPLKGRSGGKSKTVSASVPLSAQEETLGVLTVSADSPGVLDGDFVQFLRSVGQQIGVGLRNARLDREVRQKEEARGQLLDKLIVAQEEERKRIAREIHDEPAQTLTAIAMRLDQMKRHLPEDQIEVRQGLEEAHQEAKKAMEVLYQIIVELRPQALDDLGFLPAIRWHAGLRLGEKGINLEFHASGSPARLDSQIETAVFRLMQEAINNIYRHSGAKHAKIRLYFRKAAIKGIIEDDGKGFDVAAMRTPRMDSPGLGLMGMEERASILGGSLTLTSRPGKGTRVVFEVPLNAGGVQHAEQD